MLRRATISCLLLFLAVGLALTVGAPQLAAIRTERFSAAAHCARAAYCLDSGLPEQAVDALRMAIRLEPDVPEYHLLLAHAYEVVCDSTVSHSARDQEEMFRGIVEEYRIARSLRAADLQMELAYANHLLMAAAYGVSPDLEETVSAWQSCLSLVEERYQEKPYWRFSNLRFTILLHLGRIELTRYRNESARRYFTRALGIMPDSVVAKQLLGKTHHGNAGGEYGEQWAEAPHEK